MIRPRRPGRPRVLDGRSVLLGEALKAGVPLNRILKALGVSAATVANHVDSALRADPVSQDLARLILEWEAYKKSAQPK